MLKVKFSLIIKGVCVIVVILICGDLLENATLPHTQTLLKY